MASKFSILHISDIHKVKGTSFDDLYNSLVNDSKRCIEEGLLKPKYIVLSGDVIQGAYNEEEIVAQYKEAEEFLNRLVDYYLGGDKERIIIVPGNHDINRPACISSMDEIPTTAENIEVFLSHILPYRWDWKGPNLKEIVRQKDYEKRFDLFVDFYNRFFEPIKRCYPQDPVLTAQTIAFDDDEIIFACFNSCHESDHLNIAGAISTDSISYIENDIKKAYNNGYLPIGVWHHNTYGSPYYSGYMSRETLDSLYKINIRVGLYGHQHYSQIAEEYCDLLHAEGDRHRLLSISSGTLYGGEKVQNRGINRQYNVITIDKGNGSAEIEISVREDINPDKSSTSPHFVSKMEAIKYHIDLKKQNVEDVIKRIDADARTTGNYKDAAIILLDNYADNSFAQKAIDSYLLKLSNEDIVKVLHNPTTFDRIMLLISAIRDTHNIESFNELNKSEATIAAIEKEPVLKEAYQAMTELF